MLQFPPPIFCGTIGEGTDAAGIFASFPNPKASLATQIGDQILGTACLLVIILAVTDERNMKVASGLVPLLIGLGLAAIHISMAFNAGCAINPARDFSPYDGFWKKRRNNGHITVS